MQRGWGQGWDRDPRWVCAILAVGQVSGLQHRIQTGHADIGVDGADLDMMAKQLADAGSAFGGVDGFSGRVSDLVLETEAADKQSANKEQEAPKQGSQATSPNTDSKHANGASGTSVIGSSPGTPMVPVKRQLPETAGGTPPEQKDQKRGRGDPEFFDRDRSVMQAIRNAKASNSTLRGTLRVALEKGQADMANYAAQPLEHKNEFTGEHKILSSRVQCLSLVLAGTESELKSYILTFKDQVTSTGAGAVDMGQSPPCKNYKELRVIGILDVLVEKYQTVTSKSDLEQVFRVQ